jgi:branched-chain amino acid transport system substrate-binding protein
MKNRLKILPWFILLFLIAAPFITPVSSSAAEPLVIGVLHSEEYPYATMMKNSFEMALEKINRDGGIKGRQLKLVYANDQGKKSAGEKIVSELAEDSRVVMLVGAYQSSNTVYMARVADKLDRPFLVCTAADDRITQRKWKNVYRLNPPASEYTNGLEDFFLNSIKPKSMAIIYENSPYGTGGALRMMWFCRENDIEITSIIPYHKERAKKESIGSAYFKKLIASLQEEAPDVIFMVSYLNDGALLLKKLRELKIDALLCGGAGGFTHQKFITKAGEVADFLLTATLWSPQSGYRGASEYYHQYIKKFSIAPDYHGAEAYSALLVAADALKRAESFRPENIREALDNTDLMTIFGPIKFISYGKFERQNRLPTMVLQIQNSHFENIWPREHATTKFIPPPYWRVLKKND